MALTKVGPAGIGSTPGNGFTIGDSFLHATGLDSTNAKFTGIVTAQTFRVLGNFQVDGTTTTLDTEVTSVDKLEVAANNNTVGVAITQSGSGDILQLYDGSTKVVDFNQYGNLSITSTNPVFKSKHSTGNVTTTLFSNSTSGVVQTNSGHDLVLGTGAVEKVRIKSNGNVGIGTDNPSNLLHVYGQSRFEDYLRGNSTQNKLYILDDVAISATKKLYFDGGSNTYIDEVSADTLRFSTAGTERLRITSAGDMGLGTATPVERLAVVAEEDSSAVDNGLSIYRSVADDKVTINAQGGAANFIADGGSSYIPFRFYIHNGTTLYQSLTIGADGKVGIGDNSPDTQLTVKAGNGDQLRLDNAGERYTQISLRNSGSQKAAIWLDNTNNLFTLYGSTNIGIRLDTNGTERLRITSAGELVSTNGTLRRDVSTSSFTVSGDTASNAGANINLYGASHSSLANVFRVRTGSTERLRITSAGLVGIGIDAPQGELHVKRSSGTGRFMVEGASLAQIGLRDNAGGTDSKVIQIRNNAQNLLIGTQTDSYQSFSEKVRITSDGKMGLGTQNPTEILTLNHANGASIGLEYGGSEHGSLNVNSAAMYARAGSGKHLILGGNATESLRLKSDGKAYFTSNLGLAGQTSPGADIHINNFGNSGYELKLTGNAIQFNRTSSSYIDQINDTGSILFRMGSSYTEAMRITSNGYLGINHTSPGTRLVVKQNNGVAYNNRAQSVAYNAAAFINQSGHTSGGTYTGYQFNITGDSQNRICSIGMITEASNSRASSLVFHTDDNGNRTEKLRITSAGKVGINNTDPQTALNVQGTISTGRNLAREFGTVISSSTNFNTNRQASNVLNGKKNYENGGNDWLTAGNNRDNANLVIDLGAQYDVDRVVIYNQNEYDTSYREVKRFNLEGSNDNSSWTLLIDDELGRSDAHEPNPGFSFRLPHVSSPGAMNDDNEGVSYRYWRFTMKDFHGTDGYGGIMEIELYGASNNVDSEVSTHSVVASDVYTQTLSAKRLAIGENGALGDFRANANENVYINAAARFGQNTGDSTGNATRHTGWRMYGYNPAGISARYQWTQDGFHGRKSFYYYFPNGSANQAIRFHVNRSSFWSCGFITINAMYSHQNASGMLRYHFTHNANSGSSYGKTITEDVNIGNTSGSVAMNNSYTFKTWGSNGGSTTSHALELRKLNSTGNGFYITFELYGNHVYNYIDDLYMTTGHTY